MSETTMPDVTALSTLELVRKYRDAWHRYQTAPTNDRREMMNALWDAVVTRVGPEGGRATPEGQGDDPLLQQVEAAIKYASELGDQAFDAVDGRGLYVDRLAIRDAIVSLRATRSQVVEPHPDSALLDFAQEHYRTVDWAYESGDGPIAVLLIAVPRTLQVGADLRATLRAAMASLAATHTPGAPADAP